MEKQKYLQKQIIEKVGLAFTLARTGQFAVQGFALPWMDRLATGQKRPAPKEYTDHLKEALTKIYQLHQKDLSHINNGLYPYEVLRPEKPWQHALRIPKVLVDSYKAAKRRKDKEAHFFNSESDDYLNQLPEYYKRNFHFQTGGYLTEISAELYEHQVEILFSGAADAMRRLILPPMKVHFSNSDGTGLKFLEIASGTGRLSRFLALAFPKAQITCVDLSPHYLKKARERLKSFKNINFVQAPAEDLPFKNEQFDAVVSCFLFHELPLEIRNKVLQESMRVAKTQSYVGLVDSIQKNDDVDFDWALRQFPLDFHEPFYKNYIENPMEKLFSDNGLLAVSTEVGFLSKVVSGVKLTDS